MSFRVGTKKSHRRDLMSLTLFLSLLMDHEVTAALTVLWN